jgi:hypothetical protein
MKPAPKARLRDDPDAPPIVRADLVRATKVPAVAFDAARGLAALEAAIQAVGAPAAPSAAAGKSLAATLAKGAIVGLVAVGIAGGASVWLGGRKAAPPPASVMSSAVEVAPPPAPHAPSEPVEEASLPPPRTVPSSSLARRPEPHVAAPPASSSAEAPPAPSGASQLQMEMENLVRLRAADPRQALALAEEGQRRFPSGFYVQEREALAIAALVQLGRRGEAVARARAFVAAYPRSHFVERIRELTGVAPKE